MATSPNITTDLSFGPSLPIEESRRAYPVRVVRFEDGKCLAFRRSNAKLREWALEWENITKAELAALVAFYDARYGTFGLFYFDHPQTGEVDIKVRFVDDSFRTSHVTPIVASASARIYECV